MLKRARQEEDTVPIEYIKKVAEKHDEWMKSIPDCKKTALNVDDDFETNFKKQSDMIESLNHILQN
jgi:deoxyadenosine/deoxycytidine kinase